MTRSGRLLGLVLSAVAVLQPALLATAVTAQEGTLTVAEQMVARGRTSEARQMVDDWWAVFGDTASPDDLQKALWLRGRLSLDPAEAARDYERLVTEYRGGPYSDDALLRLALAAEAAGDMEEATRRFRQLALDYPTRPPGIEAAAWLEVRASTAGPADTTPAMAPALQDPPPSSEPERAAEGPADEAIASEPSPERRPESPAIDPASGPPERRFAVEIGRYLSVERAERMVERLAEQEQHGRIVKVPGSPLFRVRLGAFPESVEADRLESILQSLDFSTRVVWDVALEEPVEPGPGS